MKQEMILRVYPDQPAKKPMRDILGINNTPRLTTKAIQQHDKALFDALHFSHIRFHDAANENPNQQLIDIHRIFPFFHLDENDPENYFFGQTDDYLSLIADSAAQIDFKLGETIDHSGFARLIGVPEDVEKWARICRNIIGHYKNGEMNGMHLNITRVTVWEEPDNKDLFSGTVEDYSAMFCAVYKLLKRDFPDIRVGGPTIIANAYGYLEDFLTICRQNGVRPDYMTATIYGRDMAAVMERIANYREVTTRVGLTGLPIQVAEWHLRPLDWKKTSHMEANGYLSAESAAYAVYFLAEMMDLEDLEVAYYYSWATAIWGVLNFRTDEQDPLPVYYGLQFFQKLAADGCRRITAETEGVRPSAVLAGVTEEGKTRVLVSCFDQEPCTVRCFVGAASGCTLRAVRMDYLEHDCIEGTILAAENGEVAFAHSGRNGVYLLEF